MNGYGASALTVTGALEYINFPSPYVEVIQNLLTSTTQTPIQTPEFDKANTGIHDGDLTFETTRNH